MSNDNSQDIYNAFEVVMGSIEKDYKESKCNFFVERDLVWTVQQRLQDALDGKKQDALDGKKDGDKYIYGKEYAVNENITEDKYIVYNDYPIEKGGGKNSKCVDLAVVKQKIYKDEEKGYRAIRDGTEEAELVVEFKFEPSKKREGVQSHKGTVVSDWSLIEEDINRANRFTDKKKNTGKAKAKRAIAIYVDEYSVKENKNKTDRKWKKNIVKPDFIKELEKRLKLNKYDLILKKWATSDVLEVSVLWVEFQKIK